MQDLTIHRDKKPVGPLQDIITIDGLSGAGTSTVANLAATMLNCPVLDSGSLYRAYANEALRYQLDPSDEEACGELARRLMGQIAIPKPHCIIVDDLDLSEVIRTSWVTEHVALYAAIPAVREAICNFQRTFNGGTGFVVEGRDTGREVFPAAIVKIWLEADEKVRRARVAEKFGAESAEHNAQRDQRDTERKTSPAQPADNALTVNTTNIAAEKVVILIMHLLATRQREQAQLGEQPVLTRLS